MSIQQLLPLDALNQLFYAVTQQITGLPGNQIRFENQPNSQPAIPDPTQDVIYLNIITVDDPYDKQTETLYNNDDPNQGTQIIAYTKAIAIDYVLCGPDSYDLAEVIHKRGIFTDPIQYILNTAGVSPLCNPTPPQRVPFSLNGQNFERSDFRIVAYCAIVSSNNVPYLSGFRNQIFNGEKETDFTVGTTNPVVIDFSNASYSPYIGLIGGL